MKSFTRSRKLSWIYKGGSSDSENEELCCVCFDDKSIKDNKLMKLSCCLKLVHEMCLNKWIKVKSTCPGGCGQKNPQTFDFDKKVKTKKRARSPPRSSSPPRASASSSSVIQNKKPQLVIDLTQSPRASPSRHILSSSSVRSPPSLSSSSSSGQSVTESQGARTSPRNSSSIRPLRPGIQIYDFTEESSSSSPRTPSPRIRPSSPRSRSSSSSRKRE